MGYRIQVGKSRGVSLEEAVAIVNGFLPLEALEADKRQYVLEEQLSRSIIVLPEREVVSLGDNPLPLLKSVEVVGNHAVLRGCWKLGFIVMASDCMIRDAIMEDFSTAIMVNAHGNAIENITIENCRFRRFTGCCIMTGSDLSNSTISSVAIRGCTMEGAPEMEEELLAIWYGAPVGVMVLAASGQDDKDICNCITEHVQIENCIFRGRHRNGINTIPAAIATNDREEVSHSAYDCQVRDVKISNCSFAGAYDATINFMGSYMHNVNSITDSIEVCDCYLEYNIWGIYFCATEPCQGLVDGAIMRNLHVHRNELRLREGGSGEDSAALAIQSGRLDYADGAKANHGIVENFSFHDNIIHHTQHGIILNGADSMVDGLDTEMIGNVVRNGEIYNNRLYNVDDCFTFYGAQLEGRRVDIRIGVPPKDQTWLPLLEDHSVTTCTAKDNVIENVKCHDNYCTGYKFKYKIAGVKAGGQALAENNHVREDVILENNTFEKGAGHILVENQIVYDWVKAENCTAPMKYRN